MFLVIIHHSHSFSFHLIRFTVSSTIWYSTVQWYSLATSVEMEKSGNHKFHQGDRQSPRDVSQWIVATSQPLVRRFAAAFCRPICLCTQPLLWHFARNDVLCARSHSSCSIVPVVIRVPYFLLHTAVILFRFAFSLPQFTLFTYLLRDGVPLLLCARAIVVWCGGIQ